MNVNPTITVVVTCYKEGELLQRALDSVASQTDREFELVVVNDASPCEITNRICRQIKQDERVKVVTLTHNQGQSGARNAGIRLASGRVIIPFDGDDVLPETCVQTVKRAFMQNPGADYCFGNYLHRHDNTGETSLVDCSVLANAQSWMDPRRFAMNYILLGASPYTKSLWIKIGGYRQALDGWEDMDFWMRAMVAGAKGLYLPHVIYEWHRRGQGVNSAVPLSRIWETHLRNHRFHKQFGHWELTAEGFLDFILREYEDPGVRRVVRCCGYLILPLPRHCMGRFVRALFKYVLPLGVVKQLTCLNRWHRKPSQVRRG